MTLRVALSECVLSDSEKAKSYLYKKFYGYVMAVVIRYMQQEEEAEEVVNECFVKVFKKIGNFERHAEDEILEKTFKSWLARIAVTTSIDALRVRKQMDYIDDADTRELSKIKVNSATSLEVKDILNMLNYLPAIQKTIFNLYEIEGYSHEEIGQTLNIPESTSRTYLTRAKKRLRELYHEHHNEFLDIKS